MEMLKPPVLTLTGLLAASCAVVSAATIWAVLRDPVGVATTMDRGALAGTLTLITRALALAVTTVLRYL